ncbi:MAG: hypothetical protein JSV59_06130 [Flavobacteriaceae bacterium]|nr:MAG: hypothetical protein JSV59_06130 [Flavobacteriaceae bacterium]
MKSETKLINYFLEIIMAITFILLAITISYGQDDLQDAIVTLSFIDNNEAKIIQAKATDQDGSPIEDLELYFYVQRTFSLLPIGDFFNTTDENGIVEIPFPEDLPGDMEGHVKIIVKILESDNYNDLTLETIKNWGVPTPVDQFEEKRSLWAAAANAPITLVISTCVMILAIWFIIGYIIFILYKISKIKSDIHTQFSEEKYFEDIIESF